MIFPLEQTLALAGINRQLLLKFFDIARTSGGRQVTIGAHALAAIFDPGKLLEVAQEVEQDRQALVADTKAALEEWQESAVDIFSPENETAQLAFTVEPWFTRFLPPYQALAGTAAPATSA